MGCRGARGRARAEAARVPLPRGAARWCARASSPALFCGVGGLRHDMPQNRTRARRCNGRAARWPSKLPRWRLPILLGGAPRQTDVARPPRPCTAASSKGEGALATSRGEIGGRLGEAPLPGGRDKRGRSRWGLMSHAPRPVSGLRSHVRAPVPTSPAADKSAGGYSIGQSNQKT